MAQNAQVTLRNPPMVGGAAFQKSFHEWKSQHANLYSVILLLLLTTLILFANEVPPVLKAQANTLIGRVLLLVALYFIVDTAGWVYGCLALVAVALLLAPSREVLPDPRETGVGQRGGVKEGFSADVVAVRDVPKEKGRWFVERIFQEEPERIEEDRVVTSAGGNSQ
jgi:hypothetical protein